MATAVRRHQPQDFDIHEDGPSTEDTEMNTDALGEEAEIEEYAQEGVQQDDHEQDADQEQEQEVVEEGDDDDDMSDEEVLDEDMKKLQDAFPGFRRKYRLIKRIGEGTYAPSSPALVSDALHIPLTLPLSPRYILHRL